MSRVRLTVALSAVAFFAVIASTSVVLADWGSPKSITVHFDNLGDEKDISVPGTTEFEFMDTKWQGGVVTTTLPPAFVASGEGAWLMAPGGSDVTLGRPVLGASFFFVHGPGEVPATVTFFDEAGTSIDTISSRVVTFPGDRSRFVTINFPRDAVTMFISGGVMDAFTLKYLVTMPPTPDEFVRGDCNVDGTMDIADVVSLLVGLFVAPVDRSCDDSCDSNDDGGIDISDAVATLRTLFAGAGPLPGGVGCAADGTGGDPMGCDAYAGCP